MGERDVTRTARRVVVKVGSSSLTAPGQGLDDSQFAALARQIATQRAADRQVILVSSGAIAAGRELLGLSGAPRTIPLKQACAATGQRELMDRWETAFRPYGIHTAQVLLTSEDVRDRARFVNARNTFETLLRFGVVPTVNENDTVSVDEIKLGDNDHLAALVTNLTGSELLVLLTDTDGLYTADPNRDPNAQRIPFVAKVDNDVLGLAGEPASDVGRGGMRSKVRTAATAGAFGVATIVAHGRTPDVLEAILTGNDVGTLFAAQVAPLSSRKHWIVYSAEPKGTLVLDPGAVHALRNRGSSLLPSGIVAVAGEFAPGDPVRCVGPDGAEVARGLTNYGVSVLVRVCGLRSREIRRRLGDDACDEAIHRDDLVLVGEGTAVSNGDGDGKGTTA